MQAGAKAGCSKEGYRQVYVDGVPYLAHRLAWKMTHGSDPVGQIDHIDGNRSNNRIANLRDVTPRENNRNRHVCNSNTGYRGVSYCKAKRRYLADIGLNGHVIHIGRFIELSCAVKARQCAEKWLFGNPEKDREAA